MTNTSFIETFPVVNKILEHAILQSKTPNDVRLDMLRIRDIDLGCRENYRGCISPEGYPHAFPVIVDHYNVMANLKNFASVVGLQVVSVVVPFGSIEDYELLLNIKECDD